MLVVSLLRVRSRQGHSDYCSSENATNRRAYANQAEIVAVGQGTAFIEPIVCFRCSEVMDVPFVLYRNVADTRDKQGPKEDGEADLVKNDKYIASLRILLEALDGHFWVAHDGLIGHVVQDGCHVILIHEEVNHWQIVAIIHYEKQDVVESVAWPRSLDLKEQNGCGTKKSQAPNQYCSYHQKLIVVGTRCFLFLIAELTP